MTGYMVAHPDDIPSLMLAHQQSKHSSVTVEGILVYHRLLSAVICVCFLDFVTAVVWLRQSRCSREKALLDATN